MKFWTDFRPATGALAVLVGFLAVGAAAQTTNTLSDAEIQGRKLAQQLCDAKPTENFTNTGVLKIRDANGVTTNIPVHFKTKIMTGEWQAIYFAHQTNTDSFVAPSVDLTITHKNGQPNRYLISEDKGGRFGVSGYYDSMNPVEVLEKNQIMSPFAGSDFWIADLGLEFFHWPSQKILKKEFRRNCACQVLESTNPSPATNGYSRVVSWIDEESGGIVQAEAYDAGGRLLKEFAPKSFKKVNGQWELQEMEIRNVQTGSRTRLEFDLKK